MTNTVSKKVANFSNSALTEMPKKRRFRMPPTIQSQSLCNGGQLSIAKTVQLVDSTGVPIKPFVDVMESIRMVKDRMLVSLVLLRPICNADPHLIRNGTWNCECKFERNSQTHLTIISAEPMMKLLASGWEK